MAVFRAWLAGVAVLGLLVGCTPAPARSTMPVCASEGGRDPHPCTQQEHEQMMEARKKLYAEAEAVYRKFWAELERLERAGGATELTPVLLETTTGEYQKWKLKDIRELRLNKATAVGGAFKLAWFKPIPDQARQGSIVTLRTCMDASSIMMGFEGEKAEPGLIGEETGFFVRDTDGRLKIITSLIKDVEKC